MSFRFWQRIRLAPWITLNLSGSSASLSLGPPGARYTIGPRGHRVTAGLPGSGLFYSVHAPLGGPEPRRSAPVQPPAPTVGGNLDLGFFRRLVTPAGERAFVDGLRALNDGHAMSALAELEEATDMADAAWMAGMLRLQRDERDTARAHLESALRQAGALGAGFAKYGIQADVSLPVAPDILAHIRPGEQGARLALVEIAQFDGRVADAMHHLERLLELAPADPVVALSFVELALSSGEPGPPVLERIVALTAAVANETPVHAALMLYRGRALARLGLAAAAVDTYTAALRRVADRPPALLRQLRYDRALLHEAQGRRAQARREYERLYAEAPDFADVRQRLALPAPPATA